MQICKLDSYGVPMWGPSPQTSHLLAAGTPFFNGTTGNMTSYLRIGKYNVQDGMSKYIFEFSDV